MYRRPNSNANDGANQANNTGQSSYGGNAGGYRPMYVTPPCYASGMQSTIAPSERKKKSQFNRGGSISGLSSWISYIVIGFLLLGLLVTRFQVNSARKRLDKFQKTVTRDEVNYRSRPDRERKQGGGQKDSDAQLSRKLEKLERSLEMTRKSEFDFQSKVENIEREKVGLLEEINHMKKNADAAGKGGVTDLELKKFSKRETVLYSRIDALIEKIKSESRRELEDQFTTVNSSGAYYVKFLVDIPDSGRKSFFIETASINDMPHSVHLFLEQVKNSLWNGCSFIINAPHILQAGPHTKDASVDKIDSFKKLELDTVSFQEYSIAFPHKKYTFGFAGRPGGPDFYINKMDNSDPHGPGGQMQQVLEEEADPCFAKVIDGFEVVDELFKTPTAGDHNLVRNSIDIVKVEILDASYVPPSETAAKTDPTTNSETSANIPAKELKLDGGVEGQMM